jgi:hypothetical protein
MKKLAGLLGAVLLLVVCSPLAQGAMQISVTGFPTCVGPDDTFVICNAGGSFNANGITITTLSATSNSPGTSSLSFVTSATVNMSNTDTIAHTITIDVSAPNFMSPTAPPPVALFSHIGGTVFVGSSSNAISFSSCVNGTPGCPGSATAGPGTPDITTATLGGGSFSDDKFAAIASLTAPYSLAETITITLGAGARVNFSASTTLVPVPEPASVMFLGTTLLGVTTLLRKKFKRA